MLTCVNITSDPHMGDLHIVQVDYRGNSLSWGIPLAKRNSQRRGDFPSVPGQTLAESPHFDYTSYPM